MDDDDIDLRSIIDILRRRLRLIFLSILFATACAVVGIFMWPPVYTASALIFIETTRLDLLNASQSAPSAMSDNAKVDSQVEILRSDTVLLDVIARLGLLDYPEFGASGTTPASEQSALERLKAATTIHRRGLTYLTSITVRSQKPEHAALIANAIVEAYRELQLRAKVEGLITAERILASSIEGAREEFLGAEYRLSGASQDQNTSLGGSSVATLPELFELQSAAGLARSQYQTLLERRADLALEVGLQIADSRVVTNASVPQRPSFPNPGLVLMLAGLCGLVAGIVLALIKEAMVGGFSSDVQLTRVTHRPSLGDVPLQPMAFKGSSIATMMIEAPLSAFAEAMRRVRIGLDRHLEACVANKGRVIMVSSSVVDEGKTALALSLARVYALSGKRTILIDCDLRCPSLHHHLDVAPDIGLFDYLVAQDGVQSFAPMIVIDADTGLSTLVGARPADVPTDQLFNTDHFRRLIAAAVNSFDIIILDAPPLLPVVDGLCLARYADVVLFVVKCASTAQSSVCSAMRRLEGVGQNALQVVTVLNQQHEFVDRNFGSYRSYYQ